MPSSVVAKRFSATVVPHNEAGSAITDQLIQNTGSSWDASNNT